MAEAATEVTLQYPGAEPTVCLCHPRQGWDAVKCLGNKPIVVRGTWYVGVTTVSSHCS